MTRSNMYKLSVKQWNPFKGCRFKCVYCKPSFQAQSKRWGKKNCPPCYDYTPHPHPERLSEPLPRTRYMQFIFALASSDPAFCPTDYLQQITNRMEKERDKTFLIQSKEPKTFSRVKWPGNVILGTTVETNKDELYKGISQAPLPSVRVAQLAKISHPLKMLTYEPVLDFDVAPMVAYAEAVKPCMIWLGYDSKNCGLPEPSLDKFKELYWELGRRGFTVILKTVRPPTQKGRMITVEPKKERVRYRDWIHVHVGEIADMDMDPLLYDDLEKLAKADGKTVERYLLEIIQRHRSVS